MTRRQVVFLSEKTKRYYVSDVYNGDKNETGVGGLPLLQRIFPTQELNWGLLHCRQILYQLSYQGMPLLKDTDFARLDIVTPSCLQRTENSQASYKRVA